MPGTGILGGVPVSVSGAGVEASGFGGGPASSWGPSGFQPEGGYGPDASVVVEGFSGFQPEGGYGPDSLAGGFSDDAVCR